MDGEIVAYVGAERGTREAATQKLREVLRHHGMPEALMERATYTLTDGTVIGEIALTATEVPRSSAIWQVLNGEAAA